jgi:curved DNA-binding protein CbpA
MIDYFALLEQPRKPSLDPDALKQKYHALARQTQPDEQLNEAYRVLGDPKSRLEHLLNLEGRNVATSSDKIPDELVELFMEIAPTLNATAELRAEQIDQLLGRVTEMQQQAMTDLHRFDSNWREQLSEIEKLYRRLSYLSRWNELLAERRFQLLDTP